MNSAKHKKKATKVLTDSEFDAKFDQGGDITPYLDFDKAVAVKRVNVDFPHWMVKQLDQEAKKLNISRQAVIKMWVNDQLIRKNLST
jgi:hypothetical protein